MSRAQFYLITPVLADAAAFLPALKAALAGGRIACLLLRLADRDEAAIKAAVKLLGAPAQQAGAAVLIEGVADNRLAVRCGADGVHVDGLAALGDALETMKPERIVGIGGLKSRHDCMEAGEAEVDYLAFGLPKPDGFVPPLADTLERCQWWAQTFLVPCIGYAPQLEDIPAVVATGAEFVALGDAVWNNAEGPEAAVRAALAAIAAA